MVELQKIDKDVKYRDEIISGYNEIRNSLQPGAAKNLAKLAEKMMG
jgi:adenylate kinase